MKVIGLTGGIASGKSTVSKILAEKYQFKIIDADKISRELTKQEDVLLMISEKIGKDVLNNNRQLNRKKMGELICKRPEIKKILEDILHPLIERSVCNKIRLYQKKGEQIIIYDCPLLFETNNERHTDAVLLVTADEAVRLKRLTERDHLDRENAQKRIAIQMSDAEKIKKSDYILYNNTSLEDLEKELDTIVLNWIHVEDE